MTLKVALVNESDAAGGAARAAERLHRALRQQDVDSTFWVERPSPAADGTVASAPGDAAKLARIVRPLVGHVVRRAMRTGQSLLPSPAVLPSRWPRRLNDADADVVHLHWVCGEMMSVEDIGRLRKPVVWTLHDMWAFAGAEHYPVDERWATGYTRSNRPSGEGGPDLNRWTWRRKRRAWQRPMSIVAPSRWLADCARRSVLMRNWPVTVVPNPIDLDVWRPVDRALARDLLGLPQESWLVAFGAMGGGRDPRKGMDLLADALGHLGGMPSSLRLLVFGEGEPRHPPSLGFPVHYTRHLHDDISLRLVYSAADALVIPSRQDNLPNTGVEALACGTPVVAFDTGGLPDIVQHQRTGWLAQAHDPVDLAEGLRWVLQDPGRLRMLREAARTAACERFAPASVVRRYVAVYDAALKMERPMAVAA